MGVSAGFYPAVWGTFSHTRQSCTVVVFVSVSLFGVVFFFVLAGDYAAAAEEH